MTVRFQSSKCDMFASRGLFVCLIVDSVCIVSHEKPKSALLMRLLALQVPRFFIAVTPEATLLIQIQVLQSFAW